jgi:hypothetical protein
MKKQFNDTGTCNPQIHFMVDISNKLNKIIDLVENGHYFSINRPYQYGKTTTQFLLTRTLMKSPNFILIKISFEGVGDTMFSSEVHFCQGIMRLIARRIKQYYPEHESFFTGKRDSTLNLNILSEVITQFVEEQQKKVVLIIDEVDKCSNNQMFLSFIGMLRSKYLLRNEGIDFTFQSVILAGVHDIKTLKLKLHPDAEHKFNSPWNIAVDFTVDLSFNAKEIETMLSDYAQNTKIEMDIPAIAERIHYYTNGYPYLVSKLCKITDEILLPSKIKQNKWDLNDMDEAFKYLVNPAYTTTLFDSITKCLENDINLYHLIQDIAINGDVIAFNIHNATINLGSVYGIISENNGKCKIHNRIFEQKIYGYQLSKIETENRNNYPSPVSEIYFEGDRLNLTHVLQRFQQFMKENYTEKESQFIEREGRLLFLSFLKPIINGKGFDFKEPVVGDERRMDLVVIYNNIRNVIELKIWRGNEYHQTGLQQLSDYLDIYSLKKGYLLIFNFNAGKAYKEELIRFKDKEIFAIWV